MGNMAEGGWTPLRRKSWKMEVGFTRGSPLHLPDAKNDLARFHRPSRCESLWKARWETSLINVHIKFEAELYRSGGNTRQQFYGQPFFDKCIRGTHRLTNSPIHPRHFKQVNVHKKSIDGYATVWETNLKVEIEVVGLSIISILNCRWMRPWRPIVRLQG